LGIPKPKQSAKFSRLSAMMQWGGVTQIKESFIRFEDAEMEDCRLTVREIADEVGIGRRSANTIVTKNLGM
jgi:hypothetical protein